MPQAVAPGPQRLVVAPDAELMAHASEIRQLAANSKHARRAQLLRATERIENVAQAYAELAAAFALKVAECAQLRAERDAAVTLTRSR